MLYTREEKRSFPDRVAAAALLPTCRAIGAAATPPRSLLGRCGGRGAADTLRAGCAARFAAGALTSSTRWSSRARRSPSRRGSPGISGCRSSRTSPTTASRRRKAASRQASANCSRAPPSASASAKRCVRNTRSATASTATCSTTARPTNCLPTPDRRLVDGDLRRSLSRLDRARPALLGDRGHRRRRHPARSRRSAGSLRDLGRQLDKAACGEADRRPRGRLLRRDRQGRGFTLLQVRRSPGGPGELRQCVVPEESPVAADQARRVPRQRHADARLRTGRRGAGRILPAPRVGTFIDQRSTDRVAAFIRHDGGEPCRPRAPRRCPAREFVRQHHTAARARQTHFARIVRGAAIAAR